MPILFLLSTNLENNWIFGITELIALISAFLTFTAICVSLYLSQKAKTLKFKIFGFIISKDEMKRDSYQPINILNNGHIKFTCSFIGYRISKDYYYNDLTRAIKKLDNTIINGNAHTTSENLILPTYIPEGDVLELGLFPADYSFEKYKKNYKVYIFVIINGKIYKKYTGCKFKEFSEVIVNLNKKSMHTKSNVQKKEIENNLFRYNG